jgi:hypothetical protein
MFEIDRADVRSMYYYVIHKNYVIKSVREIVNIELFIKLDLYWKYWPKWNISNNFNCRSAILNLIKIRCLFSGMKITH